MYYRLPTNRFFVWLDTLSSFQFSKTESTCAMKGLLDITLFRLGFSTSGIDLPIATLAPWLVSLLAGGGGSAIPCGLVLPSASAKLDEGKAEPSEQIAIKRVHEMGIASANEPTRGGIGGNYTSNG